MPIFSTFLILLAFLTRPLFSLEMEGIDVPEIPSGSCSFSGGKLCPGVPGNVLQQNLQHGECAQSLAMLCADVEPGEGRLANCLKEKGHLVDTRCANWGRRVGLDFGGASGAQVPREAYRNPHSDPSARERRIDKDSCFGSAWFTNPACKKESETVELPTDIGLQNPFGGTALPPTPAIKLDTIEIPTLESLLIKY